MLFKKSKKIFFHIDCDSFFAACEILKNPSLKNKYVCVWEEIIIASTYNCKKLGIKTGTPVWEAKKILKWHGIFCKVDHVYYSEVSQKFMNYLRKTTLKVEEFSIDEAFCEITWLPEYYQISIEKFAKNLQKNILKEIWIPVSIGISNTRIKAKIFSKINKPFGIFYAKNVSEEKEVFSSLPVSAIPFIGKKYTQKLQHKAPKIYNFLELWYWYLQRKIGKNATDLRMELSWVNRFRPHFWKEAQSSSRSRSFNKYLTCEKDFLRKQALIHFEMLFQEMSQKQICIKRLWIFFRDKDFEVTSLFYDFPDYTNDHSEILSRLQEIFIHLYSPDRICRSVGVIFDKFSHTFPMQLDIFHAQKHSKQASTTLSLAIQSLNTKYDKNIIHYGCSWYHTLKQVKLSLTK